MPKHPATEEPASHIELTSRIERVRASRVLVMQLEQDSPMLRYDERLRMREREVGGYPVRRHACGVAEELSRWRRARAPSASGGDDRRGLVDELVVSKASTMNSAKSTRRVRLLADASVDHAIMLTVPDSALVSKDACAKEPPRRAYSSAGRA